jgi:copper homeostasis protein
MTEPVLIEVCVDSVASAVAAQRGGAQRIELCSDLLEGGITPSLGLLEAVRSSISVALHAMIRPRGGDFCYSDQEFEIMLRDIEIAKRAHADGVALGMLDPSGRVDITRTRKLVELANPMSVTFHRGFDLSMDLHQSLEDVCQTGADRLLTSGGEQDALRGIQNICKLRQMSQDRIKIMAGGGINAKNAAEILHRTGVNEVHVGLATPVQNPMLCRARISLDKTRGGEEYLRTEVLEESVRELKGAIAANKV